MRTISVFSIISLLGVTLAELRQLPLLDTYRPVPESYAGDQVWRLEWAGLDRAVQAEIMDAIDVLDLDVWRSTPQMLDLHLKPSHIPLLSRFILPGTSFAPFITDLSTLTQPPVTTNGSWDLGIDTSFHNAYHSLEDIYSFGDALVAGFDGVNGVRVEGFSVGETFEGRKIRGWKAWYEPAEGSPEFKRKKGKKGKGKKPDEGDSTVELEFVVQSGQHAREWVGPATAVYWFHDLVLAATSNPEGHQAGLLKSFTFSVIPTINPDGYVYSHEHSRLWRKNRQDTGSPICRGIDLNSNWGYKWKPSRASPCSDAYSGKKEFEAYETKAMGEYLVNSTSSRPGKNRRVRAFVDLHSYGQLFMFPFAYSCDDFPPDAEMLMEAGLGVAKAMRMGHGEAYQAGQACDLTYRAPGDAIDYAYGVVDARWSYSAELRDTGTYGFMLPPALIRPNAEEVAAGLLYLAKFIYVAEVNP